MGSPLVGGSVKKLIMGCGQFSVYLCTVLAIYLVRFRRIGFFSFTTLLLFDFV